MLLGVHLSAAFSLLPVNGQRAATAHGERVWLQGTAKRQRKVNSPGISKVLIII